MRLLKANTYLIISVGIVIVLAVILVAYYKYNSIITCKLLEENQKVFLYHLLNVLYSVKRIDEGRIVVPVGDYFRFVLDGKYLYGYYAGSCKINKKSFKIEHGLKNALYSDSFGDEFCVMKFNGVVKLCNSR